MLKLTLLKVQGLCISFYSLGDSVAVQPSTGGIWNSRWGLRLDKISARQDLRHLRIRA